MNILSNNSAKLNEIIFANRNKAYGAYVLRISYNNTIVKSLSFLLILLLFLFGISLLNRIINQQPIISQEILVDDLKNKDLIYEVDMEQPQAKQDPIQQKMAASAAPTGGVATKIIDTAIDSSNTKTTIINPGKGPDNATGNSFTSTVVTTSTVQIKSTGEDNTTKEPVVIAEEMPEFEGGTEGLMRYIQQHINYPEMAKDIGQQGTVFVSFVVNELGYVENVKVLKGIGYGCDEETVRVVSQLPKWKKVGKNSGHAVKVRFNMPVKFKLR